MSNEFCHPRCLIIFTLILSCSSFFGTADAAVNGPVLSTGLGRIRGVVSQAENGRSFHEYLGIPYAKPPLGRLRFSPPVSPPRWTGILSATRDSSPCLQRDFLGDPQLLSGSEDCLYLNVYTPKLPSEVDHYPLPVMIWIHGGSWFWWSGTKQHFNPNRLMNKDLILVTINYRLGWFGFLSTEDEVVRGNNGLKDQALAIKWVKDNIVNFGGDPSRITVAGQDTGAVSAHLHMFSPLSKDLISSVIVQSGSAFAPDAIHYPGEALSKAKRLAEVNVCPTTTNAEMVACLRLLDPEQIVVSDATLRVWNGSPFVPLRAVVEGVVDGAFLVEHPESTAEKGNQANVSMMIGTVRDEGAVFSSTMMFAPSLWNDIDEHFRTAFPAVFAYEEYFSDQAKNEISDSIRSHYFGDRNISMMSVSDLQQAVTTRMYRRPVNWIAETQRLNNTIYLYQLAYRGSLSFSKKFGAGILDMGVCHCDELLYLFDFRSLFRASMGATEEERTMVETISELWYNFVATGNPTPESTMLLPNRWAPVERTGQDLNTFFLNGPQNFMMLQRVKGSKTNPEDTFWENSSIAHNPSKDLYQKASKSFWKSLWGKVKSGFKKIFG